MNPIKGNDFLMFLTEINTVDITRLLTNKYRNLQVDFYLPKRNGYRFI